jgi:hypothetical protein
VGGGGEEVVGVRALETIGFSLVVIAFWVATMWVFIDPPNLRRRKK